MSGAMSHSDELRPDFEQEAGLEVARTLHLALCSVKTHDVNNQVCVRAIHEMSDAINVMIAARGQLGLYVLNEYVYVGEERLRTTGTNYQFLIKLVDQLRRRGVGTLQSNRIVTAEDCRDLVLAFKECSASDEDAFQEVRDRLSSFDSAFVLGPVRHLKEVKPDHPTQVNRREKCKQSFFQAVTVTEGLMRSAHLGKPLRLHEAKRTVQHMVDMAMDEEFTLLGMTTMRSYDNYTFYHSVNVCIYAITLGKKLGLSPIQMSELGTGALMHDLGKVKVPIEFIRKEGKLSDEEVEIMRLHPVHGAKELIKTGGFSPLALKAMIGCFEHHMAFDGSASGYPQLSQPYHPHVFGRLISVVDCFDALTTRRIYRDQAMRRDRALSLMLTDSGTKFDPILLRMFTNMIGIYPIGTTVRLASGRLAVVVSPASDPKNVHRPVVRPFTDAAGLEVSSAGHVEIDLSERSAGGNYPDEIVAALDAEAMGFDSSKYFV